MKELLEDLSGLKAIEEREGEPTEDYEAYRRERRSSQSVYKTRLKKPLSM